MRLRFLCRARPSRIRAECSAAAGGAILVARFAAAAALNYAFGIGLAWLLVPAKFGIVSTVQNVLLLAAGLLTAGLPWALAIRIAQAHAGQVPAAQAHLAQAPAAHAQAAQAHAAQAAKPEFRMALIANLGLGLWLGAAFIGVQLSGLRLVPTGSPVLDLIVAAEIPVLAVNAVLAGAAQGSRRFAGLGAMQGGEILFKCAAAAVLVAGLHTGPAGVALSFLLGTIGSVLIGLRTCKGLLPGRGPLASLRFLADSGSIWFASASKTFLVTADLLGLEVAGRAAGMTAAVLAGYQACGLLGRASFYVGDALADAVFPFIARSEAPRDKHRWFLAAARWVPLLIIPVQAALFAAPGPVLRLFLPHQYAGAHALLRVLAAGTLGALIANMLMKSLFAIGCGRQVGRRMPITVIAEVTGLMTLVPRYGALGAAWSFLLASAVSVVLVAPLYLKALRVRPPAPRRLAAYAVGFAPTAAVLTLAGRAAPPLAWVLIAAAIGLFIFPARRMRLITDADISFLRGLSAQLRACAQPRGAAGPRSRGLRAAVRTDWRLAAFCAGIAAVALLYNIVASPDVLYDEAAYTFAAQKVAAGWHLTLGNQPLFVHPPLMFLLQAAWLGLTGYAYAAPVSAIRAARLLSASIGLADVLLVAALAYRLASSATPRQRRVVTGLTAVLAGLDPVLTRYDRQDVIEPLALCLGLLTLHAAWQLRDRGALAYVSVTGLLGGLALLTNEITVCLLAVPPLFALLQRDRALFRRSLGALAIAVAFLLLFLLWAVELGLAGSFMSIQTATLRRIVGLVQITGLNVPGVSIMGALAHSAGQYSSSYIVLAAGLAALVWCGGRRNTASGNFLLAWLAASYAFGGYIVAVGTLNEQFFVYLLPASLVGGVLLADALLAGRVQPRSWAGPLPLAAGAVVGAGLVALSAANWVVNYGTASDGMVRADRFIAATLPACAAVNASGDAQKYSYLLPGRVFAYFSVGPAALADGVHYFLLSPNDATEHEGDMSPALASWIRDHGRRLAVFPSHVYQTVQLWHVPASPYDPVADVIDIPGGVYVNTVGSHCGGYTVTDGSRGSFYSAYRALGGKGLLGDPLSQPARSGPGRYEQPFDGVVLRGTPASPVRALPIVAMLAKDAPAVYRRAALPPVYPGATAAERRGWLTNPAIRHAYLGSERDSPGRYAAAVRRYGKPLGPPVTLAGAGPGAVAQAFADIVLEARGGTVHAATVTPLAARVLDLPAAPAGLRPPPLPDPFPPGRPEPTSAEPFVLDLGVALLLYAVVVTALARRRRGPAGPPPGGAG